MDEKDLYEPIGNWLADKLRTVYPRAEINCYDTSGVYLWQFLQDRGVHKLFPDYLTYEIKVDITGVIKTKTEATLAFIECKIGQITLRDIGQLLGYSRVANPTLSLLISPKSISRSVHQLLEIHRRYDVLEYAPKRKIRVCQWNVDRNEIDLRSILPHGDHF